MILTNDPSITAWGYAIVDPVNDQVVRTGCIKTESQHKKLRIRKGDDTVRRISEIAKHLVDLIQKYNVQLIISELPHGSQSASAAVMIGAVTGIMQTIGDSFDIAVEWYSEGDSKKCLLGKRAAVKNETIVAVDHLYIVHWSGKKYIDEAVADALSIYHYAKMNSPIIKVLRTTGKRLRRLK